MRPATGCFLFLLVCCLCSKFFFLPIRQENVILNVNSVISKQFYQFYLNLSDITNMFLTGDCQVIWSNSLKPHSLIIAHHCYWWTDWEIPCSYSNDDYSAVLSLCFLVELSYIMFWKHYFDSVTFAVGHGVTTGKHIK